MKKLIILFLSLSPVLVRAFCHEPQVAGPDHSAGLYISTDTLKIEPKDAGKHIGEVVTIEGRVASARVFNSTALLNIGGEYPNQLLTVVLKGEAIPLFKEGTKPAINATGTLVLRNGKPEMVITGKKDIIIKE